MLGPEKWVADHPEFSSEKPQDDGAIQNIVSQGFFKEYCKTKSGQTKFDAFCMCCIIPIICQKKY